MILLTYFELCITIVFLEDIPYKNAHEYISKIIGRAMLYDSILKELHKQNIIKNFVVGLPYPVPTDTKIYLAKHAYVLNIRAFDRHFLEILQGILSKENCGAKVLMSQIVQCNYKPITTLTALTPVVSVIKGKCWTIEDGFELLQDRLHANAERKAKIIFPDDINKSEQSFITGIEMLNNKMNVIRYKEGVILGTKIKLHVDSDEHSQRLAFVAMGAGLGEKGTICCGYCASRF